MLLTDVTGLLTQAAATQANVTSSGDPYLAFPPQYEDDDREVVAKAIFHCIQERAGALNARVEGSYDNETWFTLAAMTALAAPGTQDEVVAFTNDLIPPYLRAKIVSSGGANIGAGSKVMIAFNRAVKTVLASSI